MHGTSQSNQDLEKKISGVKTDLDQKFRSKELVLWVDQIIKCENALKITWLVICIAKQAVCHKHPFVDFFLKCYCEFFMFFLNRQNLTIYLTITYRHKCHWGYKPFQTYYPCTYSYRLRTEDKKEISFLLGILHVLSLGILFY